MYGDLSNSQRIGLGFYERELERANDENEGDEQ